MILQSLRLMKKRKNNCYKHSPSFYFANVCSLSPSCLLNGNGSFSQLPVQNNYKISALSFAFFGVALSASPSAALTLNASSFSFKDTLAAGTSVYCLPPLFCPVSVSFSASGIFFAERSATSLSPSDVSGSSSMPIPSLPFSSMLSRAFKADRRSNFSANSCSCEKGFCTSAFAVSS